MMILADIMPARGFVYDTLAYKNNGWKITFLIKINKWSVTDEIFSIFEFPHPSNSSLSIPKVTMSTNGNNLNSQVLEFSKF